MSNFILRERPISDVSAPWYAFLPAQARSSFTSSGYEKDSRKSFVASVPAAESRVCAKSAHDVRFRAELPSYTAPSALLSSDEDAFSRAGVAGGDKPFAPRRDARGLLLSERRQDFASATMMLSP